MARNRDSIDIDVNARDNVTLPLKAIESGIIRFVGAITASLVALRAATFQITSAADLQEQLINVQKTTEFTDETIQQLGASLRVLSRQVNVTATDLAKIAAVGGQLGLGNQGSEALLSFTDSAARMSSVLDVAVENAANGIAKITNIFKIGLKDAENIVSAFNELSNNSTASGEDLLDVVQRIGDAGGTINLEQSLGLAATGVDLGLTLETIGTSFTKIFVDMQSKASQFAQFMGVSTKEWAATVEGDGIGALKLYLAKLRELGSAERARVAEQLTGGGRVFSLVNKLVQDTNNTILDKNIGFASEGLTSGLSAITEQKTVLQGFNAQLQITGNHFTALASEVGEKALPVVTTLLRRFQEWADSPEVLDGVIRLSETLGSMAMSVIDLARFVANLNVNWDNMVKIGAAWIALNIVRSLTTWLGTLGAVRAAIAAIDGSGMRVFAARLQTISNTAKATAVHIAGLAASTASAVLGAAVRPVIPATDTIGRAANTASRTADVAAAKAHAAALKQVIAAQLGLDELYANSVALAKAKEAAETAATQKQIALQQEATAHHTLAAQRRIVDTQKALAVQIRADALYAANAKYTNALILADRARSSALATATTQKEVKAAQASYAAKLGAAQRAINSELAATEAAYAAKRSLLAGELAAARVAYAERLALVRQATATELAALETLAAASTARTLTTGAVLVAGFKKILSGLMKLFSIGLWGALILTILDMTGLLGPLAAAWQKVTDAIGLTSEAARKLDQQERIRKKNEQDEIKRLAALRNEYINLALAQGGLNPDVFDAQVKQADNRRKETAETSVQASAKFAVSRLAGQQSTTIKQEFDTENVALSQRFKTLAADIDTARKGVAFLQKEVEGMENRQRKGESVMGLSFGRDQLQKAKDGVNALLKEMDDVQSQIAQRTDKAKARVIGSFDEITGRADAFAAKLNDIYTTDMARLVESAVLPAAIAKKQLADITKQIDELDRAMSAAADGGLVKVQGPDGKDVEISLAAANAQMVALTNAGRDATSVIQHAVTEIEKLGDANKGNAVEGTLLGLINNLTPEKIRALADELNRLAGAGSLTGTVTLAATKGPEAADGTANISGSDLALARLRTEKEILDARIRLLRETINQELDEYGDGYSKGLVALEDYYQGRKVLIEEGIRGEIALRKKELEEAQHAFDTAGQNNPNDRLAQQESAKAAQARIRGDIAVLEKRLGAVAKEVDRDRVADIKERNRELLDMEIQLAEQTGDVQRAALLRTDTEHEDLMTRLQSERLRLNREVAEATLADDTARLQTLAAETAKLDRTIEIVIELKELGKVEAEVNEFLARTEAKLRLGLTSPAEIGTLVADQLATTGPKLEAELEGIRAKLAATQGEAEKAILQSRLERAAIAAVALREDIVALHESALRVFENEIDIKIRLGLVGQTEAGEELVAFSRAQAEALRQALIVPLQQKQSQGIISPDEINQLNSLILRYEDLRNTVSDLASDINGNVREAFVSFLSSVADGTTRLSDAFDNLGKRFRSIVAETLATDLVDKFLGPFLSGAGSLGDIVSKTLSPGRQKGDTKSNALWVKSADTLPGATRGPVALLPGQQGTSAQTGGLLANIGTLFRDGVSGLERLLGGSGDKATGLLSGVAGAFAPVTDFIAQMFGDKAAAGTDLLSGLLGNPAAGPLAEKGVSPANPLFVSMVTGLPGIPGLPGGKTQDVITDKVATVDLTGGEESEGVFSTLSGMFGSVKEGFMSVIDSVGEGFSSVIGSVSDGFGSLVNGLGDLFSGLFSGGEGGGGGGFLSLLGAFFHTGGIVGGNGTRRSVNPMAFIGAPRYHTGGLPGLAPNEVATVLEKGEEVLTAKDPRHVANGGGLARQAPSTLQVQLDPRALNMTMRDWLEGELAHLAATR